MSKLRVGLVSDTHGRLSAALWDLFSGVSSIIHAGDVGESSVLADLETIAPVLAVRGNTDAALGRLPEVLTTDAGGLSIRVQHVVSDHTKKLERLAAASRTDLLVFGHTHRPFIQQIRGTLFVNPGSASRSRTGCNTAGLLTVDDGKPVVSIHDLEGKGLPVVQRWPPG